MQGLYFDKALSFRRDLPMPKPDDGEALIKVRLAGICQTDLELTRNYQSFRGILGHEFVGEMVEDTGPFRKGQRVVGEINISCGACEMCRTGNKGHCLNERRTLGIADYDGTFAEYVKLPIKNILPVPDNVPDEVAVFTEPLAAAYEIPGAMQMDPGQRILLIGTGKLGLLCAQIARNTASEMIALSRQPRPIELLTKWGIPTINTSEKGWEARIKKRSFNMVIESTGSEDGFAMALDYIRPMGTIVLKSTYAQIPQANLSLIAVDELKVIGTRCGPFPAALRALSLGLVEVQSMIDRIYPLEDAMQAFEHAAQRGVLKILLRP